MFWPQLANPHGYSPKRVIYLGSKNPAVYPGLFTRPRGQNTWLFLNGALRPRCLFKSLVVNQAQNYEVYINTIVLNQEHLARQALTCEKSPQS
jgi:hypothetical protein